MSKPDFSTMTTKELRLYVLQHREDDDAVHALVNRVRENGVLVQSDEHLRQLIQSKINAREDRAE